LHYARALLRREQGRYDFTIDDSRQMLSLTVPKDLERTLKRLAPKGSLPEDGRLHLTTNRQIVDEEIRKTRSGELLWPRIHLLWDLHPAVEWLNYKLLVNFSRGQAPVVTMTGVLPRGELVFLMQGEIPNRKGQPVVHSWFGVRFVSGQFVGTEELDAFLRRTGFHRSPAPNPATAMHRARYLAEEVFTGRDDRILLTTFTKNLATDISQNLRKLCSDEKAWARIEVQHLDGWVSNFLRTQGYRPEIVFNADNDAWKNALQEAPANTGLPEGFYRVEWESVVQAQNITSVEQYLAAPRIGRGTRLSRELKKRVWAVFQEYRAQLNESGKKEYVDLVRDARQLIETKKLRLPYRSVIVDEAQDMSSEAFKLLRTMVTPGENDLFIVGDAHQRIYRHRVSLGKCGIDIRGRGKKLKINYRTTDEIRKFAVRLLEGRPIDNLDGGEDDQKGYMSVAHGDAPIIKLFQSAAEEIAYIREHVRSLVADGTPLESICVVTRTKALVQAYAANLRSNGIEVYEVKRDTAEQRERPGVRFATMHRVKGLEFEHIIIAAANDGVVPLPYAMADADDSITERNLETGERALLYVALTRAKRSALITAYGKLSSYLSSGVPEAAMPERGETAKAQV
jgi:superfamily I DNA/RNA helicase